MLIPYSTPLLDTTLLEIRTRIPKNTRRVQRYVKVKCVIRPWSHKVEYRTTSTANSGYARFVLGLDEGNVRIWKVKASEKLGVAMVREWARIEYCNKLKERWAVDAEVARISRFNRQIVPSAEDTDNLRHTMLEARRVKKERRRKCDLKPKFSS